MKKFRTRHYEVEVCVLPAGNWTIEWPEVPAALNITWRYDTYAEAKEDVALIMQSTDFKARVIEVHRREVSI